MVDNLLLDTILPGDCTEVLAQLPENSVDLVFADPPYALPTLHQLPGKIFASGVVEEDGMLVIEHPTHHEFEHSPLCQAVIEKVYGRTAVTYFTKANENSTLSGNV